MHFRWMSRWWWCFFGWWWVRMPIGISSPELGYLFRCWRDACRNCRWNSFASVFFGRFMPHWSRTCWMAQALLRTKRVFEFIKCNFWRIRSSRRNILSSKWSYKMVWRRRCCWRRRCWSNWIMRKIAYTTVSDCKSIIGGMTWWLMACRC